MTTKEKVGLGLIVILAIALGIFIFLYVKNRNARNIAEHNLEALNDTVTSLRLSNGELLAYKNSLILENQELEQYLNISRKEVRELEKKLKADLLYISTLETKIKMDSLHMKDSTSTEDSVTYRYNFREENDYYKLAGYTEVDSAHNAETVITDNEMDLNLKIGLDENWKIFVTTDNPYIQFGEIQGALLDKETYLKQKHKTRFGISIQAGIGGQYGLVHKQFDVGPYIGAGFSWSFFAW